MIEELVGRLFSSRNAAHLAHFRTKSYAKHIALNEFYDAVIDAADALVEAYQGKFGLIDTTKVPLTVTPSDQTIIARLTDDLAWMGKNRAEIVQRDPALDNLLQEVEGVYLSTLYKLNHLG